MSISPIFVSSKRRSTMTTEALPSRDSVHLDRLVDGSDIQTQRSAGAKKVCIVGASGKLGQYMVRHALDQGYEVVGVCREESVAKLDAFKEHITIAPGATDDCDVIKRAVA